MLLETAGPTVWVAAGEAKASSCLGVGAPGPWRANIVKLWIDSSQRQQPQQRSEDGIRRLLSWTTDASAVLALGQICSKVARHIYLRQGGYVFSCVCLVVCLLQYYSKTTDQVFIKKLWNDPP